jgi:hypothetical protein
MYSAITAIVVGLLIGSPKATYDDIGRVNVTSIIRNHPDLGRTPCSSCFYVLQNVENPKVAVGFRTDLDGKREIFLSKGRWKLLAVPSCADCGETDYDLIAKNQKREVEVDPAKTVEFIIEREFRN